MRTTIHNHRSTINLITEINIQRIHVRYILLTKNITSIFQKNPISELIIKKDS